MVKRALSFIAGFLAFFALAVIFMFGALNALDAEADNRAARQLENDKRLMLKVPAAGRFADCQIHDEYVLCTYTEKGELKTKKFK